MNYNWIFLRKMILNGYIGLIQKLKIQIAFFGIEAIWTQI
jgi:hypothetical protein